jgi:ribosomal protein L11 methyltransferase
VEVSTSEVGDDWRERWREFHRPVLVEPPARSSPSRELCALHVRTPWMPPSTRERTLEIVIDPGQAFGTGAHATTRLCLELLLSLAAAGDRGPLLDAGTGSGVLAIAADALGYAPVRAFDVEQASVDAALANAARNGAAIDVDRLDLRRGVPARLLAPTVLANLVRSQLLELARALPCPPRHLIAGGLLAHEADEVVSAYAARLKLRERERRQDGEWAALLLSLAPASP